MDRIKFLFAILLTCCITTISCSQTNSSKNLPVADVFAGSTPCDSLIKSLLKIIPGEDCEFIKWNLRLYKGKNDSGSFQVSALYGMSQPNTNGFIGGGKKIDISGKYSVSTGTDANPAGKLFHLAAGNNYSELLLIKMDNNILHFADNNKRFIVGNAGFGYVLNRIQNNF